MTRSMRTRRGQAALGLTVAIATVIPMAALAAQDQDKMVEDALSAAPPAIRETATVMDGEGKVLREGDGQFICFPAPEGFAGPMCLDATWMQWMKAYQAQAEFSAPRLGIAYMLAGDRPDGGASNIEPHAKGPSGTNDWIVEGPHIMLLAPEASMLEALPTTPGEAVPYVMWSGTPYAHVMVPVGARPEQRAVPAGE